MLTRILSSGAGHKASLALRIMQKTLTRDMKAAYKYLGVQLFLKKCSKANVVVPQLFQQWVVKFPDKPCFKFEGTSWSYRQVDNYSNRVANLFRSKGYQHGDVVGLFMENQPEFVCVWLGLSKIGVVTALINSNLRFSPLLHCLRVSSCRALITEKELFPELEQVRDKMATELPTYVLGRESSDSSGKSLDQELLTASSTTPSMKDLGMKNNLLYIFTSGTTGLPKAAIIKHTRFIMMTTAVGRMISIRTNDVIYDPLPLYHTTGGCLGIGQALLNGCTVVLKKKFSASNYWKDCAQNGCTVAQYVGEMCRYLLAAPPSEYDNKHSVRLMFGNGIRPQIWERFQRRFAIKQIGEFYGATEGNANLINIDNYCGAIGFLPPLFPMVFGIYPIKIDDVTKIPIRDQQSGLCVKCKPGEPGELVGKINVTDAFREFQGYADPKETETKIVKDVFSKGDRAFLSGDILVMDELGYLYFKDRRGDTFRWRGENVSSSEVESVAAEFMNLRDCVVYGVKVPGTEGDAGMVAIATGNETLDLEGLVNHLRGSLPPFARPIFLRVVKELDATGTYKLKKFELQKEGFEPSKIKDDMYFLSPSGGFERLTPQLHDKIIQQEVRV